MTRSIRTSSIAVLLLSLALAPALAGSEHDHPAAAREGVSAQTFEVFKGLLGDWRGTNSKGDEVTLRYELVADGTAVMERFDMRGETTHHDMVTVYHLDGDDLMLTHYCAAGNQPRMRATEMKPGQVRFEFFDGTDLASPDAGHMHRAVFKFEDANKMVSEWTWNEGGEDRFTEVIQVERVSSRAAQD